MKIRYLTSFLCLSLLGLKAMEEGETPKKSVSLDLKEYVKEHVLPENVSNSIKDWVSGNDRLVKHMRDTSDCAYDHTRNPFNPEAVLSYKWLHILGGLKALGITNLSQSSNAVFRVPGVDGYLVKMPSHTNRILNIVEWYTLEKLGKARRTMTFEDGDKVIRYVQTHSPLTTYQGVSRAWGAQRINNLKLENVKAPEVYLAPFTGVLDEDPIDDRFYFPVQKEVKGEVLNAESFKKLDKNIINQLMIAAIKSYYLWHPDSSNLVWDGNNVWVIDTEQPNRWPYGSKVEENKQVTQLYNVNGIECLLSQMSHEQFQAAEAYLKTFDIKSELCKEAINHIQEKKHLREIFE